MAGVKRVQQSGLRQPKRNGLGAGHPDNTPQRWRWAALALNMEATQMMTLTKTAEIRIKAKTREQWDNAATGWDRHS